jgi:hypothetical protein
VSFFGAGGGSAVSEFTGWLIGNATTLRNYVLPGLTSYMLCVAADGSKVRILHSAIEQQEAITPHSHRFGFGCRVLAGEVTQRLWREARGDEAGDLYLRSLLTYGGKPGAYDVAREAEPLRWSYHDVTYREGDEYGMRASEIHSIRFSRGAAVLFRENAPESLSSVILEPWCDGALVPTFRVEPWMFQRSADP